jgi:lysophospholipase L1-like esterase
LIGLALVLAALPVAAQGRQIQIVAFGDSNTAGTATSASTAYPAVLEELLKAKGYDVKVTAAGSPGATAMDALHLVDGEVPAGTDVAIVEYGLNDKKEGYTLDMILPTMDEIVSRICARGTQVLILGIGGLDYSSVAKAHDALAIKLGPEFKQYQGPTGHFTVEGHRAEAEAILPLVEQLIARVKP